MLASSRTRAYPFASEAPPVQRIQQARGVGREPSGLHKGITLLGLLAVHALVCADTLYPIQAENILGRHGGITSAGGRRGLAAGNEGGEKKKRRRM